VGWNSDLDDQLLPFGASSLLVAMVLDGKNQDDNFTYLNVAGNAVIGA